MVFFNLFTTWVKANYGTIGIYNQGVNARTSTHLRDAISKELSGTTITVCVLEVGITNFYYKGTQGPAYCGGDPYTVGVSKAFNYGDDLQDIVSVIKSHMAPNGVLMILNLYDLSDFFQVIYPEWKDYPEILDAYNKVIALVAKANGAKLIDVHTLFEKNPSFKSTEVREAHPNDAGHAAIANLLECTLEDSVEMK
jgi:lysophospholipase L1-like esterase